MHRLLLTALALVAFAGNSLLCRLALRHTAIDPASFTSIRIIAGALVLWALVRMRRTPLPVVGSWRGAVALFLYAAAFSFAYVSLTAATGALLLFGTVQATMIGYGLWQGERLTGWRLLGFVLALAGLVGLVLPGLAAPPLVGSLLMIAAGVGWAIYSLLGKGHGDPLAVTAGNFLRAVVPALLLSAAMASMASLDAPGIGYAVLSGALTSGIGYAIWYTALRSLDVTTAAVAQLCVPLLAAVGGVALLAEPFTPRLLVATLVIVGGIALVVLVRPPAR